MTEAGAAVGKTPVPAGPQECTQRSPLSEGDKFLDATHHSALFAGWIRVMTSRIGCASGLHNSSRCRKALLDCRTRPRVTSDGGAKCVFTTSLPCGGWPGAAARHHAASAGPGTRFRELAFMPRASRRSRDRPGRDNRGRHRVVASPPRVARMRRLDSDACRASTHHPRS